MTTIIIDDSTEEGKALLESLRKNESVCILENRDETDWWTAISEKERLAIEEGLSDIEEGRINSYDDIKGRYAHWL